MSQDPMKSIQEAREKWHHMADDERAEHAHECIDYAVIAIEEAYLAGKITREGRNQALIMLGVACAHLHDAI